MTVTDIWTRTWMGFRLANLSIQEHVHALMLLHGHCALKLDIKIRRLDYGLGVMISTKSLLARAFDYVSPACLNLQLSMFGLDDRVAHKLVAYCLRPYEVAYFARDVVEYARIVGDRPYKARELGCESS